jgi:GNAT superfamily N-acetyltransferase
MNGSLRIRLLTRADLPFADSVRAAAGWNQTVADWERFLVAEPEGCFLAEWNGEPTGTATTFVYGSALAWIGMVLVHPDYRRRGIGRALLEKCIGHLRQRGVRCIKLDATPAGKKVYDGLGFKDEWTLTRWEHVAAAWPHAEMISGVRDGGSGSIRWGEATDGPGVPAKRTAHEDARRTKLTHYRECRDVEAVEALDGGAFGISRRRMLKPLMLQSRGALVCETDDGKIAGYGLLRDGSSALYLGPVVAVSAAVATGLVKSLLAGAGDRKIYWDIPDQNVAAVTLARNLGFISQRTLTRMFLGANATPGDPSQQFAIAAPELG